MFTTLYVIVGAILILGFSTDISKLPLIFRIFLTIFIIIIIMFFFLKEVTGASSIWDILTFKFLENLKK
ncbi:hypothetical protein KSU13_06970 [Fusobacterium nucleatum]|uniref:hypothetical protein n=1 Tax=Fusobacterium nucleatum TaxID=851 RepID=UPI0030CBEA2F